MAKITRYVQDKLASSLVGTPGVDESAAITYKNQASMLNDAASLALSGQKQINQNILQQRKMMSSMAEDAMRQLNVSLRQKQAVQAAVEKENTRLQNENDVTNKSAAFEQQLNDLHTQLDNDPQYQNNPEAKPDAWRKQSQELLDGFTQNTPMNPQVLADVNRNAQNKITGIHTSISNGVSAARNVLASNDLANNVENLTNTVGRATTIDKYNESSKVLDGMSNVFFNVYGRNADKQMNAAHASLAKSFLDGNMNNKPDMAKDLLNGGVFDSVLNGDEKRMLLDRAREHIEVNKKAASDQQKTANQSAYNRVSTIFGSVDVYAPNKTQTASAIDTLNGMLKTEQQKPEDQRDHVLEEHIISKRNEISRVQAHVDANEKQYEKDVKHASEEKRKEIDRAQREAKEKARTDALIKANTPESLDLKERARAAFLAATHEDHTMTVPERVARVNAATALIDEVHKQGIDVLPGEKDIWYPTQRAQLDQQLQQLQDQLDYRKKAADAAAAKQAQQWAPFYSPPPKTQEQKYQDIMVRGAPMQITQTFNPTGDRAQRVRLNMDYIGTLDALIHKHIAAKGDYPDDVALKYYVDQATQKVITHFNTMKAKPK